MPHSVNVGMKGTRTDHIMQPRHRIMGITIESITILFTNCLSVAQNDFSSVPNL